MPIPVTVPGSALPIDDPLTAVAESFLTYYLQIIANGTSGGTPSLQTPGLTAPPGNDPTGPSVPVIISKKEQQLYLRQMALAMAQLLRDQLGSFSVQFMRVADTGGVTANTGVYYSSDDKILSGSSFLAAHSGIIGFSPAAIAGGATGTIQKSGVVVGALSGATAGTPYYLGHSGIPALFASLSPGDQLVLLGYAKNATDLELSIQQLGVVP